MTLRDKKVWSNGHVTAVWAIIASIIGLGLNIGSSIILGGQISDLRQYVSQVSLQVSQDAKFSKQINENSRIIRHQQKTIAAKVLSQSQVNLL